MPAADQATSCRTVVSPEGIVPAADQATSCRTGKPCGEETADQTVHEG